MAPRSARREIAAATPLTRPHARPFGYCRLRRESHVLQKPAPRAATGRRAAAAKLVAENRRFEKPLRFDSKDAVFPDFVLKDRGAAVPMEVWGMATPEYQARKREKTAHYDNVYGPSNWWSWNGAAGDPLPDLPSLL